MLPAEMFSDLVDPVVKSCDKLREEDCATQSCYRCDALSDINSRSLMVSNKSKVGSDAISSADEVNVSSAAVFSFEWK
jgi:hypothetical protein